MSTNAGLGNVGQKKKNIINARPQNVGGLICI